MFKPSQLCGIYNEYETALALMSAVFIPGVFWGNLSPQKSVSGLRKAANFPKHY